MKKQFLKQDNPFYRTVTLTKMPWEIHLQVPWKIQRIDSGNTHGFQVRHGTSLDDNTSEFFSDKKCSSPYHSLLLACKELDARLRLNPPTHISSKRTAVQSNKKDRGLPDGVYGPCKRVRKVKVGKRTVERVSWSYDASCQVMSPSSGKTHTATRHYSWSGSKNSSKGLERLKAAETWRNEAYASYVEACDKWDSKRNHLQLKAIGEIMKGLRAEIKKRNQTDEERS